MLIDEYGYSFPSGHAMVSMAFYGLFIYILFHVKINKYFKYILSFIIFIMIMLVGISRIYLHVHYFSDVIAGFAVSVIYLIVFTRFMKIVTNEGVKIVDLTNSNNWSVKNFIYPSSFVITCDDIVQVPKNAISVEILTILTNRSASDSCYEFFKTTG